MASLFTQLDDTQKTALLPKAQVAIGLYRHHNTALGSPDVRSRVAQVDAEVGSLLTAVYDKKLFSWQELIRWVKQQEQIQAVVTVQVSNPERFSSSFDEDVSLGGRSEVGLFAVGKGKIYKRTLPQDIDKLLR